VFYINETGHGWAVSLECQAINTHWVTNNHYYDMYDIPELDNFEHSREAILDLDGYTNTAIIRDVHGSDWYPAAWSVDFDHGWYLPAAGQLRWMMAYINEINTSLAIVNGTTFVFDHPRWYWTSTERTQAHAVVVSQTGSVANYPKYNYIGEYEIGVRAVKSFNVQAQPPTIGEIVTAPDGQRGVVFYVAPDDGSYWLAALNDLSSNYQWGLENDLSDLDNYNESNQFVVLHGVHCGYDATACMREVMGTASQYASSHVDLDYGWHIPSAGQLSKLFAALPFIENTFIGNGGTSLNSDSYWTSTECSNSKAWTINFAPTAYTAGIFAARDKTTSYAVRPVWSQSCETINLPTVGSIVTPEAICTNESLTLQIPESQFANAQGWQMSPTMDFNSPIPYSGEPLDSSYNGWYLRYYAANEAGTIYSNVVNITIWPNHETSFNIMACTHYVWNGIDYDESGDYEQHLFSIHGCDSIVTMHLTIANVVTNEWAHHTCEDSFIWNGITYYETGDYEQTFSTSENCDSIVTLHLTLSEALEVDTDSVACGSLWWNGQEYTESGHYEQQFVTVDGCDSLVRMDLTVLPFPESIPEIIGLQEVYVSTDIVLGQYHYSIDSVEFATHYEWILEDADWTMDTTGTHCTLWVTTPGTATLKVRAWNGCGYTEQELIINAGFFDVDDDQTIPVSLYPNPSNGKVIVEAEGIKWVKVYDLQGQLLKEWDGEATDKVELNLQGFASALYTVEVLTERGRTILKMNVIH
jgi:hypothetical protein